MVARLDKIIPARLAEKAQRLHWDDIFDRPARLNERKDFGFNASRDEAASDCPKTNQINAGGWSKRIFVEYYPNAHVCPDE
jgi:hypothetical protein